MTGITDILSQIHQGDPAAAEELLPLVYDELRSLAAAKLSRERPGQTLQATALVHEVYLRLVGAENPPDWNSRGHFFGAAAEAMRRILVENYRRKGSLKRGGDRQRVEPLELADSSPQETLDLLALDEALEHFERLEPERAQLVKLRFFAGMTIHEAAGPWASRPQLPNVIGFTRERGCSSDLRNPDWQPKKRRDGEHWGCGFRMK